MNANSLKPKTLSQNEIILPLCVFFSPFSSIFFFWNRLHHWKILTNQTLCFDLLNLSRIWCILFEPFSSLCLHLDHISFFILERIVSHVHATIMYPTLPSKTQFHIYQAETPNSNQSCTSPIIPDILVFPQSEPIIGGLLLWLSCHDSNLSSFNLRHSLVNYCAFQSRKKFVGWTNFFYWSWKLDEVHMKWKNRWK